MTAAGDLDGGDALAQAFEAQRPRLVRVPDRVCSPARIG
jgi:hypothetical protein